MPVAHPPVTGAPLALPDALSLSRLLLAALVWLAPDRADWLLFLVAVAGLTDLLDGWVARRLRDGRGRAERLAAEQRGAWLDPLCDKAFVLSVLAALWLMLQPPLWILALIATRELLQAPFMAVWAAVPDLRHRLRYEFRAARVGKITTVLQFLAMAALLFHHPLLVPFSLLAGFAGLVSVAWYVRRASRAGAPRGSARPSARST